MVTLIMMALTCSSQSYIAYMGSKGLSRSETIKKVACSFFFKPVIDSYRLTLYVATKGEGTGAGLSR